VPSEARECEKQALGLQGRRQSKTQEFEKHGRAQQGRVKSRMWAREGQDRAPLRLARVSRAAERFGDAAVWRLEGREMDVGVRGDRWQLSGFGRLRIAAK
jgi:hypothetical protein